MKHENIIAIVCADLHLSMNPPLCRIGEPSWFDAMRRPLREMRALQTEYDGVPVLCSGDVFDHWRSPPELINFALAELPDHMIAVPGQHDLPYHHLDNIEKSAFGTLVRTHRISVPNGNGMLSGDDGVWVYGYPWGTPITKPVAPTDPPFNGIKVALQHAYRWTTGTGHTGASPADKLPVDNMAALSRVESNYHAVVYGDNHTSFDFVSSGYGGHGTNIYNPGVFMRRRSDESKHRPRIGLMDGTGKVYSHYLDTSADVFAPSGELLPPSTLEFAGFLDELKSIRGTDLDYRATLRLAMDARNVPPNVRQCLLDVLDPTR